MLSYTLGCISHNRRLEEDRFTPQQIITVLREAEALLSQGAKAAEVVKKFGITEQTYYRWRREYGGMCIEQAKRQKELEKENARLKKLVADFISNGHLLAPFRRVPKMAMLVPSL